MALGASARDVQGGILKQTLKLAAAGMALGTIASWAMAQSAAGLLFGVTARDPGTFLGDAARPDRSSRRSPAICRPAARRASTRWWRCGRSRVRIRQRDKGQGTRQRPLRRNCRFSLVPCPLPLSLVPSLLRPSGSPRLERQAADDLAAPASGTRSRRRRRAGDRVHRRPVVALEAAAERVDQHLLGERARELRQPLVENLRASPPEFENFFPPGSTPLESTGKPPSIVRHLPMAS